MGLDIITYSKNKEKTGIIEMSEKLHHAIFNNGFAGTCKILQKIKDYYKADLKLESDKDIVTLVNDLIYIRQFVGKNYIKEIDTLVSFLNNKKAYSIRITGN